MTFPSLSRADMAFECCCARHTGTKTKRTRVAERNGRSADRYGPASCAEDRGSSTTCTADRRSVWALPGQVAVLFPYSSSSSKSKRCAFENSRNTFKHFISDQVRFKTVPRKIYRRTTYAG